MRHQNSFDLLRIVFALFVLITHGYTLTGLSDTNDPLYLITGECIKLSFFAVAGFFSISGFLVLQSLQRSTHVGDFFLKRILRIFPGLIVLLFLTVVLGWTVYPFGLNHYLHNPTVYTYFSKNLLLLNQQLGIEGIFNSLPFKNVINGSLWTLPYEIVCYLFLSLFFLIPASLHRRVSLSVCILCVLLYILTLNSPRLSELPFFSLRAGALFYFMAHFFCGAFLGTMPQFMHTHRRQIALAFFIIMVLSFGDKSYFISFQALILPVLVIAVGCMKQPDWMARLLRRTGDISYGIYIYGFVVQQVLVYFFHFGHRRLILSSFLISILLGYASWKLVESRAMKITRKNISRT